MSLSVLHTVLNLGAEGGGLPLVVRTLSAELAAHGARSAILPFVDGEEGRLRRLAAFGGRLRRAISEHRPDVLHDHGLWMPHNHIVSVRARRAGIPRVVSVHGMLEPWALQYRGGKKRWAWRAYQRRDLERAAVLHATSEAEVENIRRQGVSRPIVVIPNGVESPPVGVSFSKRGPGDARTALFLSRLHPIKNLLGLVRAWAMVRPDGWRLVMAGPDETGHRGEVEAAVRDLELGDTVRFEGPVYGEAKWQRLARADLLVLPSHSENFGVAVGEALAVGVPAIASRGTPWQDLEAYRCGWWAGPEPEPLAAALRQACGLSDAERDAMGERGRALIAERYAWSRVGESFAALYRDLAAGTPGHSVALLS